MSSKKQPSGYHFVLGTARHFCSSSFLDYFYITVMATCCNSLFLNLNQPLPSPQTMYFTGKRDQTQLSCSLPLQSQGKGYCSNMTCSFRLPSSYTSHSALPRITCSCPHLKSNTCLKKILKPTYVSHFFHHPPLSGVTGWLFIKSAPLLPSLVVLAQVCQVPNLVPVLDFQLMLLPLG